MPKIFMPDATPSERIQALKNVADIIEENASYERELSDEEIDAKREVCDLKLDPKEQKKREYSIIWPIMSMA